MRLAPGVAPKAPLTGDSTGGQPAVSSLTHHAACAVDDQLAAARPSRFVGIWRTMTSPERARQLASSARRARPSFRRYRFDISIPLVD